MPNVPADLAAKLRDHAKGWLPTEAAVELLIAHGAWLRDPTFLGRCLVEGPHILDGRPVAYIGWDEIPACVAEAATSSSARQVLLLAAEFAGVNTGWTLSELLLGLDATNTRLVCDAISHHNDLPRGGDR